MTASGGHRRDGGVRVASMRRDLVLAVGLVGICLGGAAVFVKAAVETGGGVPVLPVATVLLLAAGMALARWSIVPGPRRSTARRPGPPARSGRGRRHPALGQRPGRSAPVCPRSTPAPWTMRRWMPTASSTRSPRCALGMAAPRWKWWAEQGTWEPM